MRFLLDANRPRCAAKTLYNLGHECEDVRDPGMRSASDAQITHTPKNIVWRWSPAIGILRILEAIPRNDTPVLWFCNGPTTLPPVRWPRRWNHSQKRHPCWLASLAGWLWSSLEKSASSQHDSVPRPSPGACGKGASTLNPQAPCPRADAWGYGTCTSSNGWINAPPSA